MTELDLLKAIKVKSVIPGDQLQPWIPLSEVFLDRVEDKHLYIIVHSDGKCKCLLTPADS